MGTYLVLLLVVQMSETVFPCRYPEFLQSGGDTGIRREWHSRLTYHGRNNQLHYSLATFFYGERMRVFPYGGERESNRPEIHTRECQVQITATRYLATHVEDVEKAKVRYVCMEFIKRSPFVFQLAESQLSDNEDPDLCQDDMMSLVDWVYVNKGNFYHSYEPCPLSGGFSIHMYDKGEEKSVCDGYNGETRIEVGCSEGEGMRFLFRHSHCVPRHIHMHRQQATQCIAHWQNEKHQFLIIRHDKTENLWCFRLPLNLGTQFTGHLFKNLYCDRHTLPEVKDYIAIDMVREPPRGLTALCMDDYEACSIWSQPCANPGSSMQLICAKTCDICYNRTDMQRPSTCTIPEKFRGPWEDKSNKKVYLSADYMTITDEAKMYCVDWDARPRDSDAVYIEQMFVSIFDNGCRPRYRCVQLKKHSPSVLRLKVSQGDIWPFPGTNGITVDCGSFHYKDNDVPFANNYHSKYFKTLISEIGTVYVDCELEPDTRHFEVIFQGGKKCKGSLTQRGLSASNKMKLTLKNCPGKQAEQEFACLDSTKHMQFSHHLLVTDTLDSYLERIQCWVFSRYPSNRFYLLSIEDCNEGAHEMINSGRIKPIATFEDTNDIKISIDVDDSKMAPTFQNNGSPTGIKLPHSTHSNGKHGPTYEVETVGKRKSISTPDGENGYYGNDVYGGSATNCHAWFMQTLLFIIIISCIVY